MAYVNEKPTYLMAMPNAVPPIPYATPYANVFTMASVGASLNTLPISGMVSQAINSGNNNQQTAAWASQYVCHDHDATFRCGV
jgi:hypothetical protein